MNRQELVLKQMSLVRRYTTELLDQVDPADWFNMPGQVTHIAWQVGHLALAEYFLLLDRVRGPLPQDEDLFPKGFRPLFTRLSEPTPEPSAYPPASEIRAVFDRVHQQVLQELPLYSDEMLDQPVNREHRIFTTKIGAMLWCPQHEMSHTGQIGLIRRILGNKPMW
jgi:hypothetical protein